MSAVTTVHPAGALSLKQVIARHPLVAYFVLAFAGFWGVQLPMLLSRDGFGLLPYTVPMLPAMLLFLLSTYAGPLLAVFVVTATESGHVGVRDFLRRFVRWRVGLRWYFVVLLGYPILYVLAATVFIGVAALEAVAARWTLLFTSYLPTLLFIQGSTQWAEEPGWRGFALPRLQQRYGPIAASLILGLLHGLWHLPAMMSLLGPLPLAQYAPFMLTAMMTTVLYTWVYNGTNGSVLMAILFHGAGNAAGGWLVALLRDAGLQEPQTGVAGFLSTTTWINVIAYGLAALLVIVLTRGRLGASTPSPRDDGSAHG